MRQVIATGLLCVLLLGASTVHAEESAPYDPSALPFGLRSLERLPDKNKKQVQEAITLGLEWLAAHQGEDGGWSVHGHRLISNGKRVRTPATRTGYAGNDLGITGLATLAFVQAGYTHQGSHPFNKTVLRASDYLRSSFTEDGALYRAPPKGGEWNGHWIYAHAFAAQALIELYGLSGDDALLPSAQEACNFSRLARNPYFAWRYGVKPGDNSTPVTGAMALHMHAAGRINAAATLAGQAPPFLLDEDWEDGAKAWTDKMTDPDNGRVGFITRGSPGGGYKGVHEGTGVERSEACTAVGALIHLLQGRKPQSDEMVGRMVARIAKSPPNRDPSTGVRDMWYWWFGAMALEQVPTKTAGRKWREALVSVLLGSQRKDRGVDTVRGSWDPDGVWSRIGGRVCSTAFALLALEAPLWMPALEDIEKSKAALLTDKKGDPDIRISLIRSLRAPEKGKLSKRERQTLLTAMRDPDARVARAARDQLTSLGAAASAARTALIARLRKAKDTPTRVGLLWAIFKLGGNGRTYNELKTSKDETLRFLATYMSDHKQDKLDPALRSLLEPAVSGWDAVALARNAGHLPHPSKDKAAAYALRSRVIDELDLPAYVDDSDGPGADVLPLAVFESAETQQQIAAYYALLDGEEPSLNAVAERLEQAVAAAGKAAKPLDGQCVALALTALFIQRITQYRKSWLDIDMALKAPKSNLNRYLEALLLAHYKSLRTLGAKKGTDAELAAMLLLHALEYHKSKLRVSGLPTFWEYLTEGLDWDAAFAHTTGGRFLDVYKAAQIAAPGPARESTLLKSAAQPATSPDARRAALLAWREAIPLEPPPAVPKGSLEGKQEFAEPARESGPRNPYYLSSTCERFRALRTRYPDIGRTASEIKLLMRWAKAELAVEHPKAPEVVQFLRARAKALGDEDLIRRSGKIGD